MRSNSTAGNFWEKWFWPVLSAFFLIYWGSRLLTLFTAVEAVSWHEELAVGAAAREWLLGLKTSFGNFQLDGYSGESLIIEPLAALFFKFFGMNLFALKLAPAAVYFLTLLTSAFFMRRYFGAVASLRSVFFLIFLPPAIGAKTLIPVGGHSESLFFTICMISSFYGYLFAGKTAVRNVCLALFGLLAGFNFWFYYESGIAVLACLLTWAAVSPKSFFSKDALWAGLFSVVGFSPWIYAYFTQPENGVKFLLIVFPGRSFPEQFLLMPKRIGGILLFSLPESFSFLDDSNAFRKPLAYLYFGLCLAALGCFMRKNLKDAGKINPRLLFFIIYPVVFLMVYGLTEMDVPTQYSHTIIFRYYMPLYFVGFLLLGAAVCPMRKWMLIPLVLLSVLSQGPLLLKEEFGRGLQLKGYSYFELGRYWARYLTAALDIHKPLRDFPKIISPRGGENLFRGMISEYWSGYPFWTSPGLKVSIPETFVEIDPQYRAIFIEEAASFLPVNYQKEGLKTLLAKAGELPVSEREFFYKGVLTDFYGFGVREFINDFAVRELVPAEHVHWGFFGAGRFFHANPQSGKELQTLDQTVSSFSSAEKSWYYRGLGSALFYDYLSRITVYDDRELRVRKGMEKIPEESWPDFLWGTGCALRSLWPDDKNRAVKWLAAVPLEYAVFAREGLESCDSRLSGRASV